MLWTSLFTTSGSKKIKNTNNNLNELNEQTKDNKNWCDLAELMGTLKPHYTAIRW